MSSWKQQFQKLSKRVGTFSKQLSAFAIAGTIVGYWVSYQDRIDTRHEHAWTTLRAAISWSASNNWGNVGQMDAIETMTRDCDHWWRGTFMEPIFGNIFQDCIALNSILLQRMDFGGLQAPGANFSSSNLACSNFTQAHLQRANLRRVDVSGSELRDADLRGADLTDIINVRLADISGVKMDRSTKFQADQLKCACIGSYSDAKGQVHRYEIASDVPG